MTKVVYERCYDTHIFECIGHTEYSEGPDILCSAVSILCYTLCAYLEQKEREGKISNLKCNMDKGYAVISFAAEDSNPVLEGLEAVLCGFRLMGGAFPNYISVDD